MTFSTENNKLIFNIHAILPRTRVHGPGERFVILTQGCARSCPGCINEDARPREQRMLLPVDEVFKRILETDGIEGISLSGGEPLEQMDACIALCRLVREKSDLSILVYTGFYLDEIRKMPTGNDFLAMVDLLVAGPFVRDLLTPSSIAGSGNQEIVFLTNRYSPDDINYMNKFEIYIQPDGRIIMTGILPKSFIF